MHSLVKEKEIIIENPCKADEEIIRIIENNSKKYNSFLVRKGFFSNIISGVKLRLMYKTKYIEIKKYVDSFSYNNKKITLLLKKIDEISSYIAINNLLLAYAFLTEKKRGKNIITKEDEKLENFKNLYDGVISVKEFKKYLGHYGFDNFSVQSEKFREYEDEKLKKLSEFNKDWKLINKIEYEDYIKKYENMKYPIYKYLREELKYLILKIIYEVRLKLLEIYKKQKDVFSLEMKEIIERYEND
jgi:uncharacterized membrane protein YgaE (UPF0421/DUF939 family)